MLYACFVKICLTIIYYLPIASQIYLHFKLYTVKIMRYFWKIRSNIYESNDKGVLSNVKKYKDKLIINSICRDLKNSYQCWNLWCTRWSMIKLVVPRLISIMTIDTLET